MTKPINGIAAPSSLEQTQNEGAHRDCLFYKDATGNELTKQIKQLVEDSSDPASSSGHIYTCIDAHQSQVKQLADLPPLPPREAARAEAHFWNV